MHFLQSSLTGRALESIKNIQITADNFEIAWTALMSRFENKRRLIETHVSTLFDLSAMSRESSSELNQLRDKVNKAIASLKNLERTPDNILDDMLVYSVSQRLDIATRKGWKIKCSDHSHMPTYDELDKFLASRARALEELTPSLATKGARSSKSLNVNAANVSAVLCPLCKATHYINKCPQFKEKSPIQRREIIKKANQCGNCFSTKHATQACVSKYSCRTCQKRHHTMLHADSLSSADTSTAIASPALPQSDSPEKLSVIALSSTRKFASRAGVLLATARVVVMASSGRTMEVRALLDQGSEMTFITARLSQTLRLHRIRRSISISAVGCVDAETCQYSADIQIHPRGKSSPILTTTAGILKSLTNYALCNDVSLVGLEHLSDLPLADPHPLDSDSIDIILGADLYNEIILDGVSKATNGPLAQNTIFGWVLTGPLSSTTTISRRITVQYCASSLALEQELRNFWEVEEVSRPSPLNPEEQQCEAHFVVTHSRCADDRYQVWLPFKKGPPIDIGHSKKQAEKMLNELHRRFQLNKALEAEYGQFLQEYEHLGHMQQASPGETSSAQDVYIPHHPVIRDSSAITHLRVVFNASHLTSNATSLNDHLLAGPKLQTDLSAVILRRRQYQYVYADIAKMYR